MRVLFLIFLIGIQTSNAQERSTIRSVAKPDSVFKGETYAILVGVSKYKNYPSLNFAADDALLIRNFLIEKAKVKIENIKTLLDERANEGEINIVFTSWLKSRNMKKGDRLFIYLAGHGQAAKRDQYFLTYDAEKRTIAKAVGNISLSFLKEELESYQSRDIQVVLIIDACRTRDDKLDSATLALIKTTAKIKEALEVPGMITFSAAQDGAPAYESSILGHGLFTHYFVEGALGAAKQYGDPQKITVQELFNYVSSRVQIESERFAIVQEPQYCCSEKNREELFTIEGPRSNDDIVSEFRRLRRIDPGVFEDVFVSKNAVKESSPAAVRIYNELQKSLSNYNLIYGPSSAYEQYIKLTNSDASYELKNQARLLFISRLINYAKIATIKYILGVDEKLTRKKSSEYTLEALEYKQMAEIKSGADFVEPYRCLLTAYELTDNEKLRSYLLPQLLFLKARTYFNGFSEMQDVNTAYETAETALKLSPNAAHVMHLLGMLANEKRDYAKAKFFLSKAIENAGEYNTKGAEIGKIFLDLGQYHEASLFYRLGNLNSEQLSIAYNNIALLYIKANDEEGAEKWFKLALDKQRSKENLYNLAAYAFDQGLKAERDKRYKSAERLLKLGLEQNVQPEYFLTTLGSLYSNLEQYASSRNCYLQALKINSKDSIVLFNLASIFYNNQLYDSAKHFCTLLKQSTRKGSKMNSAAIAMLTNIDILKPVFTPAYQMLIDKPDPAFKPDPPVFKK